MDDKLPENAAEDSFSFLQTALGRKQATARPNLVSHSVHGEFAYREDGWKIVFRMPGRDIASSRGKPAVVELYNLNDDLAEKHDLAKEHPEKVERLTKQLQTLIDHGRSRPGPAEENDTKVRFDVIHTLRWAPAPN